MKLYQGLTQVTLNTEMADDSPNYTITTQLTAPLHYTPSELYHYIDAVLRAGSRHDENNLRFVTDAAFIAENYDFDKVAFTAKLTDFEDKMAFARNIVADLNRHISINIDLDKHEYQLIFVD
ncbi:hypothetical protein [Lacticaseibacillus saniviri]